MVTAILTFLTHVLWTLLGGDVELHGVGCCVFVFFCKKACSFISLKLSEWLSSSASQELITFSLSIVLLTLYMPTWLLNGVVPWIYLGVKKYPIANNQQKVINNFVIQGVMRTAG